MGSNVSINSTITIEFNKPMNKTGTETGFSILPTVSGTFSWKNNSLTFTPIQPLVYNKTYMITIFGSFSDLQGNNLINDFKWSFTTEQKKDEEPEPEPTVIETPKEKDDNPIVYIAIVIIIIVILLIFLVIYFLLKNKQPLNHQSEKEVVKKHEKPIKSVEEESLKKLKNKSFKNIDKKNIKRDKNKQNR